MRHITKLLEPIFTVLAAFTFLWEILTYEVNTSVRTVFRMEIVCFLSFLEASAKQLALAGRLNAK